MEKNNSGMNRRKFLGTGLAASIGIPFASASSLTDKNKKNPEPVTVKGTAKNPYNERTHKAMPCRSLGKTGYKVGILSLGGQATLELKGQEELSEKIIHRAIDLGINYIDTSYVYGNGVSEINIGRVMASRRGEVFLACKTPHTGYDDSMKVLDEELKRLQTDHVNIWQLHNVQTMAQLDAIFAADGAIKALDKAKAEGMVGNVGITGHFEPLVLLEALKRYKFDSILLAINASDVHYLSFKNYLLPEAVKQGIATISMKVTTRGRMLSTWVPPVLEEQPERMRTPKPGAITIKEALEYNMSLPVSTTIIGVDNIEQLEENVKIAADFSPLSQSQMEEIEIKTLPIVRQGLYFRRWNLGV